jgi:hypothetical protein
VRENWKTGRMSACNNKRDVGKAGQNPERGTIHCQFLDHMQRPKKKEKNNGGITK